MLRHHELPELSALGGQETRRFLAFPLVFHWFVEVFWYTSTWEHLLYIYNLAFVLILVIFILIVCIDILGVYCVIEAIYMLIWLYSST